MVRDDAADAEPLDGGRNPPVASGWGRLALVALGLSTGLACSVALDFEQCRDSSDCSNAAGLPLICVDNQCVETSDPGEVACESDEQCTSVFGPEHRCTSAGVCAALVSEACSEVWRPEGTLSGEVVYVGTIGRTDAGFDEFLTPSDAALQAGFEAFVGAGGFSDGRAIGWIRCQGDADPYRAVEAARHLVDVDVAAIVGPMSSASALRVAREAAIVEDTFMMSPSATVEELGELDDRGLVWSAIGSDAVQANAIADRVVAAGGERIVLLPRNDAYGAALSESVLDRWSESGANVNPAQLRYPSPETFPSAEARRSSYGMAVADALQHRADTIVFIGGEEALEILLLYLIARDEADPRPPLPRFVFAHGAADGLPSVLDAVVDGFKPTLAANLEAMSMSGTPDDAQAFAQHLGSDANLVSATAYDAVVTTLLAIESAPSPTGRELSAAMARLSGGQETFLGDIAGIEAAKAALSGGGSVDVQGYGSGLDFREDGSVQTEPRALGVQGSPETGYELVVVGRYALDDPAGTEGSWVE